ncbi:glutamate--cysteine ligase [Candidatus Kinetoplastidibacterium crithidiae]|uniref:Glutamate--cysteine ligase n=1 Tax=Candidatus Kinetoplastidibacterium crithidiae TCC036E TaxID=1208918 RepID=M1L3P9_9PROT|nr:glutamate--cysteine ligase [Candidatus Kinetoplastibacterium crithidii]AFZ83086.1 glutamate--cysteine ligase [Candidatus Kinetoplastibacterium crithidii (ex Angomonas deanei ATCC 30255)]AGF47363.1 glutamate--cysteine ligase [Candidatus Kinetoplastibacterium crithidii TCC036E]
MHNSRNIYFKEALLNKLDRLTTQSNISNKILRGIEREGLRVDNSGKLSCKKHPEKLGSPLTNDKITTDYSESLLELITGTHNNIDSLIKELLDTHRFVYEAMEEERLWHNSMPPLLMPNEEDIPIAFYGKSNAGLLKHIYRKGLAHRYGKTMQCISGLHYNFSISDDVWKAIYDDSRAITSSLKSHSYSSLIRNFIRYSWLILYLFGSSPAISKTFFKPNHTCKLDVLDNETLYMPYATSLRMSDIGYQSKVQEQLKICYNDLDAFIEKITWGLKTSWPEYELIGTYQNNEWLQLNTNILQIENEYYSSIRPKCTVKNGERPINALKKRGIEYVEIRCLDIDPNASIGISKDTCLFLDAFLLFCAVDESPLFHENADCKHYYDNFIKVSTHGRKPKLLLNNKRSISLVEWGNEIIDKIKPYAELLDKDNPGELHSKALQTQLKKVNNVELTPSFDMLNQMQKNRKNLHEYTLDKSKQHYENIMKHKISKETLTEYQNHSADSIKLQENIEKNESGSLENYILNSLELY